MHGVPASLPARPAGDLRPASAERGGPHHEPKIQSRPPAGALRRRDGPPRHRRPG
jgi:hypothetical protein